MSRYIIGLIMIVVISACRQSPGNTTQLESHIDSLEKKLAAAYKPGLGEFMSGIQVHHAKLWFAGQQENWPLADFEVHELMESINDINTYNTDRPEVKQLPMIKTPLDSINAAITQKNAALFKRSFVLLTNTCNNCHQVTSHGFNIIKIPDTPPFTNQDFGVKK